MIALLLPATAATAAAVANGRAGRHESRRQPALRSTEKLPVPH